MATRPLDAFEQNALGQILQQKDVVFQEENGAFRMVGAIRSRISCMQCHHVECGDLLGAFTYQFLPVPAPPH